MKIAAMAFNLIDWKILPEGTDCKFRENLHDVDSCVFCKKSICVNDFGASAPRGTVVASLMWRQLTLKFYAPIQ